MAVIVCDYMSKPVHLSSTHRYSDSVLLRCGFIEYTDTEFDEHDIFAGNVECALTNAKIKSHRDTSLLDSDIVKHAHVYNKPFYSVQRRRDYTHVLDDLIQASFYHVCNGDLAMANVTISAFMSIRNIVVEDTPPMVTTTKKLEVTPYEI